MRSQGTISGSLKINIQWSHRFPIVTIQQCSKWWFKQISKMKLMQRAWNMHVYHEVTCFPVHNFVCILITFWPKQCSGFGQKIAILPCRSLTMVLEVKLENLSLKLNFAYYYYTEILIFAEESKDICKDSATWITSCKTLSLKQKHKLVGRVSNVDNLVWSI